MGNVGHWIATYYDGSKIFIYDSFNTKSLNSDANTYIGRLFPYMPPIRLIQVQQQRNSYDCGLLAIAFCTSVLYNRNPEHETYDTS